MSIFDEPVSRRGLGRLTRKLAAAIVIGSESSPVSATVPERKRSYMEQFVFKKYGIEIYFSEDNQTGDEMGVKRRSVKDGDVTNPKELFISKIAGFLEKYPPRTLEKFLKEINITAKIQEHNTECSFTLDVGGFSFPGQLKVELAMEKWLQTGIEMIFDHELTHSILEEVTKDEWITIVGEELPSDKKHLFSNENVKYFKDEVVDSRCEYDPVKVNHANYHLVNHVEDIAIASEYVFHPESKDKLSGDELILRNAKSAAFKRLFQKKLELPNDYWDFISLPSIDRDHIKYFSDRKLFRRE